MVASGAQEFHEPHPMLRRFVRHHHGVLTAEKSNLEPRWRPSRPAIAMSPCNTSLSQCDADIPDWSRAHSAIRMRSVLRNGGYPFAKKLGRNT